MIEVLAGFSLGLFGSLHCIGMCGPIAFALPYSKKNRFSDFIEKLNYNFGRVISYSIIGLIFGIFGYQMHLLGIQKYVSMGTGIVLLLVFIFPKVYSRFENKLYSFLVFQKLKELLSKMLKKRSKLVIGILNGFIPCGFVYIAVIASMNFSHIEESVLFMTFFGLGTIPLMLLGSILVTKLSGIRNFMVSLRKYSVLIIAVFFLLHGLSLGIPYISPNITLDHQTTEVSSDCCTKE